MAKTERKQEVEIDPYTIYCSWSDSGFKNVFGSCAAHCILLHTKLNDLTYRANLSLQDDLSTGKLSIKAHGPLVYQLQGN